VPPKNKNLQLSTSTVIPEIALFLNRRCWCKKLATYCEQANRQNYHVWNSHT